MFLTSSINITPISADNYEIITYQVKLYDQSGLNQVLGSYNYNFSSNDEKSGSMPFGYNLIKRGSNLFFFPNIYYDSKIIKYNLEELGVNETISNMNSPENYQNIYILENGTPLYYDVISGSNNLIFNVTNGNTEINYQYWINSSINNPNMGLSGSMHLELGYSSFSRYFIQSYANSAKEMEVIIIDKETLTSESIKMNYSNFQTEYFEDITFIYSEGKMMAFELIKGEKVSKYSGNIYLANGEDWELKMSNIDAETLFYNSIIFGYDGIFYAVSGYGEDEDILPFKIEKINFEEEIMEILYSDPMTLENPVCQYSENELMANTLHKEYKERRPKIQLHSDYFIVDYGNYILNNKDGTIITTKFQQTDNCNTLRIESEAIDINLQATLEIDTTGEKLSINPVTSVSYGAGWEIIPIFLITMWIYAQLRKKKDL